MNTAETTPATTGTTTGPTTPTTPATVRDPLSELTERMLAALEAGAACDITLSRVTAGGREPLERMDADEFDVFSVAQRHGPGRYFVELKVNGKYAKGATFKAPDVGPRHTSHAPAAPTAPALAGGGDMMQLLLGTMMQMVQAQQQQTTAILTAVLSRPQGQVGELVGALKDLRDLSGGDEGGGGSTMSDIAKMIQAAGPVLAAANAPAPARPVQLPRVRAPHQPRQVLQAAPEAPAPAPQPQRVGPAADVAGEVVRILRTHYVSKFSTRSAAFALFDLMDASAEGAMYAASVMQSQDSQVLDQLAALCPEFNSDSGRLYAEGVLGHLREFIAEARANMIDDLDDDDGDQDDDQDPPAKPDEGGAARTPAEAKSA